MEEHFFFSERREQRTTTTKAQDSSCRLFTILPPLILKNISFFTISFDGFCRTIIEQVNFDYAQSVGFSEVPSDRLLGGRGRFLDLVDEGEVER